MAASRRQRESDVFIKFPFDSDYQPLFHAVLFTTIFCGFRPRTSLECDDSGRVRLEKLLDIIAQCRYAIHDLSRTELDEKNQLPRFNMPFELGMFLGARYLGEKRFRSKKCLILDCERFRFQKFLSDIAGQDIQAHESAPGKAIQVVRDWLRSASGTTKKLPGSNYIRRRYDAFLEELPDLCGELKWDAHALPYPDYLSITTEWVLFAGIDGK